MATRTVRELSDDERERKIRRIHELCGQGLKPDEISKRMDLSAHGVRVLSREPHPDTGKVGWWVP